MRAIRRRASAIHRDCRTLTRPRKLRRTVTDRGSGCRRHAGSAPYERSHSTRCAQKFGAVTALNGATFELRHGRTAGPARAERRRQDDADPRDRGPRAARRRRDSDVRPCPRRPPHAAGTRDRAAGDCASIRCSPRARTSRCSAGFTACREPISRRRSTGRSSAPASPTAPANRSSSSRAACGAG